MHLAPNDPSLTLMDKWSLPTRLVPGYYWGATRNALSLAPGTLSIIFLSFVIYRRPGIYRQYQLVIEELQYTVMFITFEGFAFMLPVFMFNTFVAILVSIYDGECRWGLIRVIKTLALRDHSFQTSVFGCSLSKQIVTATMNSNFCIGFIISLMRYFLLAEDQLLFFGCYFFILIFVMFFGVVTQNDCCERILELPEVDVPIYYYSYLMLVPIAGILVNIRTLRLLMRLKKDQIKEGSLSSKKSQRDQFRLSLGFLLQSFAPFLSFGSFLVFMLSIGGCSTAVEYGNLYAEHPCCTKTLVHVPAERLNFP
ncbi:hypothetical protein PRIPAC_86726 [Pristionchus pacificus]|uniref:Uncharacterized protein n=1 Tax=Pristionchus pacificus TaxID=54126 RepID=A0A2A6CF25_PRIPA|nr:hypothetical protein PRIPAC_86726 [Pristionchus pacificus]|eukprot:PDM76611.1 hypothetical protein PRIPAC_42977 [Pristionchus pacificus]